MRREFVWLLIALAVFGAIIAFGQREMKREEAACEAKGGTLIRPYSAPSICARMDLL